MVLDKSMEEELYVYIVMIVTKNTQSKPIKESHVYLSPTPRDPLIDLL